MAATGERSGAYGDGKVVTFSDADFGGCSVSLRSTSGGIMYVRGTAVAWQSRRQTVRAESTCESELYAAHDLVKMTRSQGWLDWLCQAQGPVHFIDNRSVLDLLKQEFRTKKSKHIELRYLSVKDHLKRLCFCPTEHNLADGLTKPTSCHNILYPTGNKPQSKCFANTIWLASMP